MTPSEIADWHDGAAAWMESREDFHIQAAATIRDLEANLKIATEALEKIGTGDRNDFESGDLMAFDKIVRATQALARIKEIK